MTQVQLSDYEAVFVGKCCAVALERRGDDDGDDLHVLVRLIVEDDERWYSSEDGFCVSSFWLPELQRLLLSARYWCEVHCTPTEYGWDFKGAT